MNKFAKIFDFETGQLLVITEFDFDDNESTIEFKTQTPDINLSKKLTTTSFSHEQLQGFLKDYTREEAEVEFNTMQGFADGNQDVDGLMGVRL